jgi:UPF0489 domain
MEEHHEAFFVWHYAIQKGLMQPEGNCLLHVDEHADIGAPRLFRSIHSLAGDLENIYKFTFDELSCFEFIVPAIYQGIFRELIWIRQAIDRQSDQTAVVSSPNDAGRLFEIQEYNALRHAPGSLPGARFRYRHQTESESLSALDAVVLDIDLDYFSCEDAVNLAQKLEVSKEEFERFHDNRYHFLRIGQGSRIRMQEEDGGYFLYLKHYTEPAPTPRRMSAEIITQRLDRFAAFLASLQIAPQVVAIARSRFSGYTPSDQWQFIENGLLERLHKLYEFDATTVDALHASLPVSLDTGATGGSSHP